MKKLVALLVLLLALPLAAQADVDLSGMSYDELIALKDKINLAIWNSQQWQEVEVPQGLWKVGEDIPAGHWTIRPVDKAYCSISYGSDLKENGNEVNYKSADYISEVLINENASVYSEGKDKTQTSIVAKDGAYFEIKSGNVIFSPYSGKPSLGFSSGNGFVKTDSTPAPTPTPTAVDGYAPFDFEKASRYPDEYLYSSVVIEGTVVQLIGSHEQGYDMRVSTKGDYDDIVYILAPASALPSARIFEDDLVRIKARMYGEYTYESKGGDNITLPYALAHSIEILNLQ